MAGIGFELKKLIKKGKGLSYVKTYIFSSIITVGPTILCILMITFFQLLLVYKNVHIAKREFFMASIMYSFMFSMIVTGIFNMPVSRYISDMIYNKKDENIFPSMFGTITVSLIIGGLPVGIFYSMLNCTNLEKFMLYLFFSVLTVLWIEMIYISAIKDYISIISGFASGVIIGVLSGLILIYGTSIDLVTSVLFSNLLAFSIISISFMITLTKSFDFSNSNSYFIFIKSMDKFKSLILTSFFLTLGVYSHNIIFWFSGLGITTGEYFRFAPDYDIPSFFSFLSVMPSLVIFMVFMETSFYKKFNEFLATIENGGSLEEILSVKNEVAFVFTKKFKTLMEIQLIFTLISISIGIFIIPIIGLPTIAINIFLSLCIGYYFYILMYIVILIILYFDDKKGALKLTTIFFFLNILFSTITLFFNEVFYGTGFSIAALITLIFCYIRLKQYFDNLEYHIFKSGELNKNKINSMFSKVYKKLSKINRLSINKFEKL